MNVTLIAQRYAKALFDLAVERNALEDVNRDIRELAELIRASRPLKLLLRAPIVNPSKKRSIMDEVLKGFNPVIIAFINLLIKKRRESVIPEIVIQFTEQYNAYKNIIVLKVTSAVPLTQEIIGQMKGVMSGYTSANIEITSEIDESVVGGFVLSWDDKQYDASVRKQIEKMKKGMARINLYVKEL